MTDRSSHLRALAADFAPDAVALRRAIHRRPELGNQELETTRRVAEALRASGIEAAVRESGTGVIAELGRGDGPLVAFRADLDALPIAEMTGADYASEHPGVMHACGHDAHTAIGVGIARSLAALGDFGGRARIIFQPAEEMIPGGATELVAEGVTDDVAAILAFHVDPTLQPGRIGVRTGPITGASDRLVISLSGPGGHTSRPHRTVDLIYAAAKVAADLPAVIQRTTDPRHPVIVAFGSIHGGEAANVIPTSIEITGTVRLFDLDLWRSMEELVVRVVGDLIDPLGAAAKVEYTRGSPPVHNDAGIIDAVGETAAKLLGVNGVTETHQSMGSEDFAWYLERVPGALIRLGTRRGEEQLDLHSATFDIDESSIETGILVGTASLLDLIERAG